MRAPRACAVSSASRITTPEPSPMMKPSRSRSKGRLARAGSSLRVDSARIAPNPPTPIGVMAASEPPAIIASASPRRMISNASPMACAEAEQAVQVAEFGPLAPNRMDTCPEARLMMADGMKNGEMRRGPPSSSARCSRSIVENPPMPEAMKTPTRSALAGVMVRPLSSIANCDAAIAYWMKTTIFLTSFFSMNCSGSEPRSPPAICVAKFETPRRVMRPIPLRPARSASQFAPVPMPTEDTSPIPVTTTRLFNLPPRPLRRQAARLLSLLLAVRLDVLHRFPDARDLLGVLVRDLDAELLLERHHELHRVERVGAEVLDERGVRRHLFLVHAELFNDDGFHLVRNRHSFLLGVHPAVDGQNVSSNIRCLVRGKKAHGVRHVLGRPEPPERNLLDPRIARGLAEGARHVGLDHPRRDDIHRDPARAHLARHRLAEPDQPRL